MPKSIKRILNDFPLLSPSLSVTEARQQLSEAAKQQELNVGYGVVVDDAGMPLTCLSTVRIEGWPGDLTLEAMRQAWPVLLILPRREITDSDRDIYLVARFFQKEISGDEDFVGIILHNEIGRPNGILRKRVLTEAITGISTRSSTRGLPSGVPSEVPAEGELMIKRYGHLYFPHHVQLNQQCLLVIAINRQPLQDEAQQVELGLRKGDWPLKVVVTLLGVNEEDFLVEGSSSGIIEVPRNEDSQALTFTLIPKSLGKKQIYVLFEQGNDHLCVAKIQTEVVNSIVGSPKAAEVLHSPQLQEVDDAPDVTIYIKRRQELIYTVHVRTAKDICDSELRQIDQIDFPQRPDTYLDAIFKDLNDKTKTGLTSAEYDEEVKKIGWNLFDKLFHEDPNNPSLSFKRFYWQEMHVLPEGSTVQIISDEPYIPWEILRPSRKKEDGYWDTEEPFLCQRFALSRWLAGPQRVSRLPLLRVALVAPPSNLRWVKKEVDAITQMEGLRVITIEDKQQLEQFFQHGEADVLHFACHGKYQSADPGRSVVILGNRYLRPNDLVAGYRNFGRTQPLVFLNACDSGREGVGLVGLDGWATTFMNCNVGFFIGSVWKTTDELACEFAKVFYEWLRKGYPVGEAVRAARKAVERTGDATYLSYTIYANPRARHVESPGSVQRRG
jgi:CHAT domain